MRYETHPRYGETTPQRLRRIRRALRLTAPDFARRLDTTLLALHRWETGAAEPDPAALRRLDRLEAELTRRTLSDAAEPQAPWSVTPRQAPDFAGDPAAVSAVVRAHCLAHGHEANPAFAIETARIDPLPHQRIAVYERMLRQDPLRFLLADDAGAGKTIMTGLLIREMLSRGRIRRVLIAPPAGLVGNWERELRTLFQLRFHIAPGPASGGNRFLGPESDLRIVSLDTLKGETAFRELADPGISPYDLVVFDEAHKLGAHREGDHLRRTKAYRLAEALAGRGEPGTLHARLGWQARHRLLLTATPHMGRDTPYYALWRLLDPEALPNRDAVERLPDRARRRHFLRRTKEEMVNLEGDPLYLPRRCRTENYPLSDAERDLYDRTTNYLRETYDRAVTPNRPAVELAMTVFQRRLASSTYALLRSFERRAERLERTIEDIRSGRRSLRSLLASGGRLPRDFFETRTADEEAAVDGRERHELFEDEVLGAVGAVTVEDLRREIALVEDLRDRARELRDSGRETKFERLRRTLDARAHTGQKWLVFSEHRDTVDFLVRRLQALGHEGRVARIHGGMDWKEREAQVERFRDPEGARFLVATDAAGEGINLQFCHLMANYDIPWNPARLEQRMGRLHRYGQKREVEIVNFVAGETREGRVLRVLLEKLDTIRQELGSDKVFDVVGRLFDAGAIRRRLRDAVLADDEGRKAAAELGNDLAGTGVREIERRETGLYRGGGEVAPRLPDLRRERERERYLELLPFYARLFLERSGKLLDFGFRGDWRDRVTVHALVPGALDPLFPAIGTHPEADRKHWTVRPPDPGKPAIWVRPGEPVFDAIAQAVLTRHEADARRGTVLVDSGAETPYLLHLALVGIEEEDSPAAKAKGAGLFARPASGRRSLERRLLLIRQSADGAVKDDESPWGMALLRGGGGIGPGNHQLAAQSRSRFEAAEAHARAFAERLAARRREAIRTEAPARKRRLGTGFDLRAAELAKRRAAANRRLRKLRREADAGEDRESAILATERERREVREAQKRLAGERGAALEDLRTGADRIHPERPNMLAHALVVPPPSGFPVQPREPDVEAIAMEVAMNHERKRGRSPRDVSKPALARAAGLEQDWPGFDLLSRAEGRTARHIEVKGRRGAPRVELEDNEWKAANHLGDGYWLYAVFHCDTPNPRLFRVRNPFEHLLAELRTRQRASISAKSVREAAESD